MRLAPRQGLVRRLESGDHRGVHAGEGAVCPRRRRPRRDRDGGATLDDAELRELLYTRAGGVRFGTATLIGYVAHYDDIRFRFADYNAGVYASRNAAGQTMLSDLTGITLVPDGDVLARIPEVSLSSPKLSKPRTTAWFAQSVVARYDTCRQRLPWSALAVHRTDTSRRLLERIPAQPSRCSHVRSVSPSRSDAETDALVDGGGGRCGPRGRLCASAHP
jgi:hypothetical protein